MSEVTINKIIEVIHCDGWKHVIRKSEEDVDSKYFNLEIDYYDLGNIPEETWRKVGETQIISSLILPEFIKALQEFV